MPLDALLIILHPSHNGYYISKAKGLYQNDQLSNANCEIFIVIQCIIKPAENTTQGIDIIQKWQKV